ncbi:hypothetical protein MLD38_011071 [Melastoma candidum]|uniref:Uncharacterized protein n=1 Tax=Melastoma candidum TaxID=119954 RepID=A0ACB9R5D5_9MYRT|nr:hypothetical protein MLD38_011071 [Melastoma candidum]
MTSVVCKGVNFPRTLTLLRPSSSSYSNWNPSPYPPNPQFRREPFLRQALKLTPLSSAIGGGAPRGNYFATDKRMAGVSGDAVQFSLSPTTSLVVQKGDITKWSIDGASDAIVNPANERMLGGGGADGAIHRAAGPMLLEACYKAPEVRPGVRCPTGDAKITPGFELPASHVIHTVGPIYYSDANPQESLRNSYRNSLTLAKENDIKYIAFPAISCGVYGYPYDEAAGVAISTVKEFSDGLKEVHFVLFSEDIYSVWLQKAKDLLQK